MTYNLYCPILVFIISGVWVLLRIRRVITCKRKIIRYLEKSIYCILLFDIICCRPAIFPFQNNTFGSYKILTNNISKITTTDCVE